LLKFVAHSLTSICGKQGTFVSISRKASIRLKSNQTVLFVSNIQIFIHTEHLELHKLVFLPGGQYCKCDQPDSYVSCACDQVIARFVAQLASARRVNSLYNYK